VPDPSSELALIIAGISAGISTLSLMVSYRAYKRGEPRVQIRFDDLSYVAREIILKIENHSPATIQITEGEVYGWAGEKWDDEDAPIYQKRKYYGLPGCEGEFQSEHATGPSLPYTLEGYHDVRWFLPRNGAYTKKIIEIQVRIALGTGAILWSSTEKVPRDVW
jgi:hypothetical protein